MTGWKPRSRWSAMYLMINMSYGVLLSGVVHSLTLFSLTISDNLYDSWANLSGLLQLQYNVTQVINTYSLKEIFVIIGDHLWSHLYSALYSAPVKTPDRYPPPEYRHLATKNECLVPIAPVFTSGVGVFGGIYSSNCCPLYNTWSYSWDLCYKRRRITWLGFRSRCPS